MSKIISIGTAVPPYCHRQMDIFEFMQKVYATTESDKRKLNYLYNHSGIMQRYSVISDYSREVQDWKFYPQTEELLPFPTLEKRMEVYNKHAAPLSVKAIRKCLGKDHSTELITHLITVSCTGMSAPGLDLEIVELMGLKKNIFRTSINFMGCYAALHALKIAHSICASESTASVLIVCTELCTIHFQREQTLDNIASSLLFGDGSAAVLVKNNNTSTQGLYLDNFYSEIISKGKTDMAWELSSSGFLMTLSGYIPELIEQDFNEVVSRALKTQNCEINDVTDWCIHPGGKRILNSISKCLHLKNDELKLSYDILKNYGNISSATILFVLEKLLSSNKKIKKLFGASFGPGLTMETFTAHN